ncbi:transposase [Bailinhaonella thermotolerans]|uniref:Transposase n=1 Tax=Bailinhaonella thermotolerans TaxID=1070861 RepID=A0A3A4A1N8_9ACTN|nr:transposase [Bailinhaonella thermotolerans]RJL22098.1 transposase [Bailinhaonella thermotolerans]
MSTDRWFAGPDGLEVRQVRSSLCVQQRGRVIAYCSSVEEVAQYVDLADLCEVIELPFGSGSRARNAGP